MKSHLLFSVLLLAVQAQATAGFFDDFEDEALTRSRWTQEGGSKEAAVISTTKAASGKQSLALITEGATGNGAWLSKAIDLSPDQIKKGKLTVSWKEIYTIPENQARVRIAVIFVGADVKQNKFFSVSGQSPGWDSAEFDEQRHEIPLADGAKQVKFKIMSFGERTGAAQYYLDDLKIED